MIMRKQSSCTQKQSFKNPFKRKEIQKCNNQQFWKAIKMLIQLQIISTMLLVLVLGGAQSNVMPIIGGSQSNLKLSPGGAQLNKMPNFARAQSNVKQNPGKAQFNMSQTLAGVQPNLQKVGNLQSKQKVGPGGYQSNMMQNYRNSQPNMRQKVLAGVQSNIQNAGKVQSKQKANLGRAPQNIFPQQLKPYATQNKQSKLNGNIQSSSPFAQTRSGQINNFVNTQGSFSTISGMCPVPYNNSLFKLVSTQQKGRPLSQIPEDLPTYTKTSYGTYGNLKTTMQYIVYLDDNNVEQIVSTIKTVQRIDPRIPQSFELPATLPSTPFNGIVKSPATFTNWDGLSEAIFQQLNLARTNPTAYAAFVEKQARFFQSEKTIRIDGFLLSSFQGRPAWTEAVNFLKSQTPVKPLRRIKCLDCSTSFMVKDMIRSKRFNNTDSTGMNSADRIRQACLNQWSWETLLYGKNSARSIVINFIVDDGLRERVNRKYLFHNLTQVGVSTGCFNGSSVLAVLDFLY